MAATSATTFSVGSAISFGPKASQLPHSKPFGVRFNSKNSLANFGGLKARTFVSVNRDLFHEQGDSSTSSSFAQNAQKPNQTQDGLHPVLHSKWQFLEPWRDRSTLGTSCQDVSISVTLHLYDIANVKGVVSRSRHRNTPSQVLDYTGSFELANCLKGVNVVVIPALVFQENWDDS
ncbi:hypothetical protein Patl1_27699 [Pistacia atlantica]|uniref:Uncharacterized protein n=1 Tax=Pistacia atlantica TaxID=434234 RepID=A0ACC1BG16_9ROSI|nr:hypothetical protein Patl1_27699 [Pistacia atlantica]